MATFLQDKVGNGVLNGALDSQSFTFINRRELVVKNVGLLSVKDDRLWSVCPRSKQTKITIHKPEMSVKCVISLT